MADEGFPPASPIPLCPGSWPEPNYIPLGTIITPVKKKHRRKAFSTRSGPHRNGIRKGSWAIERTQRGLLKYAQLPPEKEFRIQQALARLFAPDSSAYRRTPTRTPPRTPKSKPCTFSRQLSSASSPNYPDSSYFSTPELSPSDRSPSIFSPAFTNAATPNTPLQSPGSIFTLSDKLESHDALFSSTPSSSSFSTSSSFSPLTSQSSPCPPPRLRPTRSSLQCQSTAELKMDGPHTYRPNYKQDSKLPCLIKASNVSKFEYHHDTYKRTNNEVDYYIAKLLLNGPRLKALKFKSDELALKDTTTSSSTSKLGFVYVMTRSTSEGFVKIGISEKPEVRRKRISARGKYGHLKLENHPRQRAFEQYIFTETIIKEELYNIRYNSYYTVIGQEGLAVPGAENGYTEWYRIDPTPAHNIIEKWRKWLQSCEPYDKKGKLKSYWRHLIEKREIYNSDKHGDIHTRWSELLMPPTSWELNIYKFKCFFMCLLKVLRPLIVLLRRLYGYTPRWFLLCIVVFLYLLHLST